MIIHFLATESFKIQCVLCTKLLIMGVIMDLNFSSSIIASECVLQSLSTGNFVSLHGCKPEKTVFHDHPQKYTHVIHALGSLIVDGRSERFGGAKRHIFALCSFFEINYTFRYMRLS